MSLFTSKAIIELCTDRRHGIDHARNNVSEQIGTDVRWHRLIERYVNEEVGVCLDLFPPYPFADSEPRHATLIFQKAASLDMQPRQLDAGRKTKERARSRRPRADDPQLPVTIPPGKPVEQSQVLVDEALVWPNVRSVARLYGFDDGPTLLVDWSEELPGGLIEVATINDDREFQLLRLGGDSPSAVEERGAIDARIQGGGEMVEYLAKEQAKRRRQDCVSWIDQDCPCPVILWLHDGGIGVVPAEVGPPLGQFFSLRVCPIYLLPTI